MEVGFALKHHHIMNLRAISISISDQGVAKAVLESSYPRLVHGDHNKHVARYRTRSRPGGSNMSASQVSHLSTQPILSSKSPSGSRKISSTFPDDTVGIIGGVSVSSTINFIEKLVRLSSEDEEECLPFILSSDPSSLRIIETAVTMTRSRVPLNGKGNGSELVPLVEKLRRKRELLEKSGAQCIVMPCHVLHAWHKEISNECSLPFLHVGECVAKELKEANMKPIEGGSNVKIGVVARDEILRAGYYQDKLQNEGFEVVLPDRATMEHIINPAIEAMSKKDMEGAKNLLRVAIQILLVRAVNTVILASDELQDLLPHDDPLIKKCINPMDALARSTISWGKQARNL